MTRTKRKAYRILSMFVAFLVLCSTFTAMSVTTLSVGDDMRIVDLSVEYYSGSTFTGGMHVWNAPTSDPGHLFSYRINFSLSGNGEFDAGEIRLTIPTRLLKDRNGDYADKLVMSIPSVDEVENYDGDPDDLDISFVYEIEGDNVVVYNYAEMSAATTEYIEMGYSMSESTFEYKDMAPSDDFIVNLAIMNGTSEISSRTENAGPV